MRTACETQTKARPSVTREPKPMGLQQPVQEPNLNPRHCSCRDLGSDPLDLPGIPVCMPVPHPQLRSNQRKPICPPNLSPETHTSSLPHQHPPFFSLSSLPALLPALESLPKASEGDGLPTAASSEETALLSFET